jgi:hypothetical protein
MNLARHRYSVFFVMLPFWLATEVKPQLALGFVAIILFQRKVQIRRILVLASYIFLSHALVQLKFAGNINYLWIQKLLKYSSASLKQGYEISYWKAIAIYSGFTSPIRVLSTIFILVTIGFIIVMAKRGRMDWAFFIAILLPLQNTYLHLYDLAPLGVMVILGIWVFREIQMLIIFSIFLQFFPLSLASQIFVTLLFISLLFILKKSEASIRGYIFIMGISFVLVSAALFTLRNQSQELQIIDMLVVPAMLLIMINRDKFVNLLDPGTRLK